MKLQLNEKLGGIGMRSKRSHLWPHGCWGDCKLFVDEDALDISRRVLSACKAKVASLWF